MATSAAAWFLPGNMLDPVVVFADVPAPDGYAKVLCDWLAGPAPTDLHTVAGRLADRITCTRPQPLILVGHSAGGVLAMLVALRVPGKVHGLIVLNTGAHTDSQRNPDMPDRVRHHFGPELVGEFVDRCHARPLKPGMRDALIRHALHGSPQRYLDAFVSIRRIDLRPELARIQCPTVVVYGRMDQIRQASDAHELATGIPSSELIPSDSGHSSPLEDPDTVQRALSSIAARIACHAADPPSPPR